MKNFTAASPFSCLSGSMLRSRSEENLSKLDSCLDNMDDDVSKLFMECYQTNFRKDSDLLGLFNDYFTISKRVSEVCESIRKCFLRAEQEDCLLVETLHDFEEEKVTYEGLLEASFRKTFRDLRNFNEFLYKSDGNKDSDSDFLKEGFLKKLQICHEDLGKMILKLESTMKQIDKKLKRVRGKRAIITALLVAPLIAGIAVSKVVAGIFSSLPLEPITTFAVWKWKKSTETLKREKTAMDLMERGFMVALKEIEKISKLVDRLEIVERSIRVTAEFAVKKQSQASVAMGSIEAGQKSLKSTLVDLGRETSRCDSFMKFGRSVARDKIVEFLSHGEIKSK